MLQNALYIEFMMDIDFDCPSSFVPSEHFSVVRASLVSNDELRPHNCGTYIHKVPVDPQTGLCSIPYKEATLIGFEKIDFLHLKILDNLTYEQLNELRSKEPDWSLLQNEEVVQTLFHLGTKDEFGKLKYLMMLRTIKPNSLEEVADCLALIRPSKSHLINKYIKNKQLCRKELYDQQVDSYTFKRSHAFSYALNIAIQLNQFDFLNKIIYNNFIEY